MHLRLKLRNWAPFSPNNSQKCSKLFALRTIIQNRETIYRFSYLKKLKSLPYGYLNNGRSLLKTN